MMKKGLQLNVQHLLSFFFATVIGVSLSYVVMTGYTKFLEAQMYTLPDYIAVDENNAQPDCPKLVKVEAVSGAIILKDECTNLSWHRFDLPLQTVAGDYEGYTYNEAKQYCEGLATIPGVSEPIFRLPTTDELLSLVDIPCAEDFSGTTVAEKANEGCSFITRRASKYNGTSEKILPTPLADYDYMVGTDASAYPFAEGAYWASNELDMKYGEYDQGGPNESKYEAASSVNLRYGTVNNPIFGKDVRLNVRCIYNKPDISKYEVDYSNLDITNYTINDVQWWSEAPSSCANGKKLKMAYRQNLKSKSGNINDCPEGLNTSLTGEFDLCTGITSVTDQCVIFDCGANTPKKRTSFNATESPIKCE